MCKTIIVISRKETGDVKDKYIHAVIDATCFYPNLKSGISSKQAALDAYKIYSKKLAPKELINSNYCQDNVHNMQNYPISVPPCFEEFTKLFKGKYSYLEETTCCKTDDLVIVMPNKQTNMKALLETVKINFFKNEGDIKNLQNVVLLNITMDKEFNNDEIIRFVN